jgi:hypothetical protein
VIDFQKMAKVELRYLGSAVEMPKEDLKRAVVQALPEGEQLMATPAEQWIQEGLIKGIQEGLERERQLLLRMVRRRFGETTAQQSQGLLARVTDASRLEDLGEVLLECENGEDWLNRLEAVLKP